LLGYLAARKAESHRVLTGVLIGLVGVAIYVGSNFIAQMMGAVPPDRVVPPAYLFPLAHALKLAGGALGGYLADKRAR
jgi:hypothetical protein